MLLGPEGQTELNDLFILGAFSQRLSIEARDLAPVGKPEPPT